MARNSSIEWTQSSWNPITGCSKISPGCRRCYAERMTRRLQAIGLPNYANGFSISMHENSLELPLSWKKPQTVFVNSMSDLFHKEVPVSFIQKSFAVMKKADWHIFQVLTKRSDRLLELSNCLPWASNIWMGVSVENADYVYRINHLKATEAKVKFLSIEPLLGPLPALDLGGIDWVIVGGESGPGSRPTQSEWVVDILHQCKEADVPFFFKQWGGVKTKTLGRDLEGRTWSEMPKAFQSCVC